MQAITATVKILDGKMFGTGIKYAKQHAGRFDPATKTWTIQLRGSECNKLNAPAAYGWSIVSRSDAPQAPVAETCRQWTAEQGCPLHGETCPGRR